MYIYVCTYKQTCTHIDLSLSLSLSLSLALSAYIFVCCFHPQRIFLHFRTFHRECYLNFWANFWVFYRKKNREDLLLDLWAKLKPLIFGAFVCPPQRPALTHTQRRSSPIFCYFFFVWRSPTGLTQLWVCISMCLCVCICLYVCVYMCAGADRSQSKSYVCMYIYVYINI